jgi:hypothetical protein
MLFGLSHGSSWRTERSRWYLDGFQYGGKQYMQTSAHAMGTAAELPYDWARPLERADAARRGYVHAATPAALPRACCGSTTAHGAAQRWLRREKCFTLPIRLRRLWLLAMTCSSTFVHWFCLSVLRLTQSSVLVTHDCYGRCFTASSRPLSNSSALSEARCVR